MSLVNKILNFFVAKKKPTVYDSFPSPSLCGNITLENGMTFRLNPKGVAVPVMFDGDRSNDARAVVGDYLSETYSIPKAMNFAEPLEWFVSF